MFICELNDGSEMNFTGTVELDGYDIGDTLLEEVYFLADIKDGELVSSSVRIRPDCAEYFEALNKEKWLTEMVAYIKEQDVFGVFETNMDIMGSTETYVGDDVLQN